MSANIAFLTRLARIAGETARDEERAASARVLVHAYETVLYAQLGITSSRRPTAQAKEHAREALEALRREVLKGEIGAAPGAAGMYAAVRERIDMTRRTLVIRITADEGSDATPGDAIDVCAAGDVAVAQAGKRSGRPLP